MAVDIRNLTVTVGGRQVVQGVDLTVGDGERVGLVGPSGSGKSMIVRAMLGLLPPSAAVAGRIALGGVTVADGARHAGADAGYALDGHGMADLRGRYVGTVFQNPSDALSPVSTVARQVALPLRLHYDLTRAEREDRVRRMLTRVGLDADEVGGAYPHQLSGGQRQRVAIATALVTAPRLIVADEPTTALDSITQRRIVDLLVSLVDDAGASMLFVTHDFSVLARAATRCVVLDDGRVAESGPTDALLAAPSTPQGERLVRAARALTLPHGTARHGREDGDD